MDQETINFEKYLAQKVSPDHSIIHYVGLVFVLALLGMLVLPIFAMFYTSLGQFLKIPKNIVYPLGATGYLGMLTVVIYKRIQGFRFIRLYTLLLHKSKILPPYLHSEETSEDLKVQNPFMQNNRGLRGAFFGEKTDSGFIPAEQISAFYAENDNTPTAFKQYYYLYYITHYEFPMNYVAGQFFCTKKYLYVSGANIQWGYSPRSLQASVINPDPRVIKFVNPPPKLFISSMLLDEAAFEYFVLQTKAREGNDFFKGTKVNYRSKKQTYSERTLQLLKENFAVRG